MFEILLRFSETKDWGKSLAEVIPNRKAAEIKQEKVLEIDDSSDKKPLQLEAGGKAEFADNEDKVQSG